jgi:flagellar biosynthetic protein FliR
MLDALIVGQLYVWIVVFCRMGAAMMVIPIIGDLFVPVRARLLLALAITVIIAPVIKPGLPPMPANAGPLVGLVVGELLIGIAIGTVPRILFSALEVAGMIIGQQAGLSNAYIYNPALSSQGSLPGSLLAWVGMVLVLISNTHHLLLTAVADSYTLFKPGAPLPVGDWAVMIGQLTNQCFAIGIKMAAPFLAVGTMFSLALGLVSRMAPLMQVYSVFTSVQVTYGLFLFALMLSPMIMFWMRSLEEGIFTYLIPG